MKKYRAYRDAPKPKYFDKMVEIACVLSRDFPFVRVDFFCTKERLYVSELTFYPGGGFSKYDPPEFDAYMGELFKIN